MGATKEHPSESDDFKSTLPTMGSTFAQPATSPPTYHVLRYVPYEVRLYEPCFLAETTAEDLKSAFETLSKYVGACGTAENSREQQIEVAVSLEGIPFSRRNGAAVVTAPLLTHNSTMQFLLSPKYKRLSEVPFPTDPHVRIRRVPKRIVAVTHYYGWVSESRSRKVYEWLCRALQRDRLLTPPKRRVQNRATIEEVKSEDSMEVNDGIDADTTPTLTSPYYLAQYHPPFSLPCCRQIEVWVPLDPTNARLLEMVRGYFDYTYSVRKAMDTLMDANYYDDPFEQEYDSEHNDEVNQELEVPTSEHIKRGAKKVVHYAEKFLNRSRM